MVINSNPVIINGDTYSVSLVLIIQKLSLLEGRINSTPVSDDLDESNVLSDIFTSNSPEAQQATSDIMEILQNYIINKNR
tara:strand:- start:879 stop:1118 length:240 start_codon:yes stop_codon:yes gene_type:complete